MSVGKRDYLSRLQTLLIFLILNGTAKTKLAILPFLCCEEIVKNSIDNLLTVTKLKKPQTNPVKNLNLF